MDEKIPLMRRDLEFIPVQQGNQQMILIKDHLGLVKEGQGITPQLYQFMTLLDGTKTIRDLQMELMRQRGGVLVGSDEVHRLLSKLDESCLLDSDKFKSKKDQIVVDFVSKKVRPCSLCGQSYPRQPAQLTKMIDDVLASQPPSLDPEGNITALLAPHIDLAAGHQVYASAYGMLKYTTPSRIVLLGTGHRMFDDLFSLTDKDFETPLGIIKNEPALIRKLRKAGGDIIAADDFAHRSEHSIEFQVIFLQHLLAAKTFTIIPILCGGLQSNLPSYERKAYLEKTGTLLQELKNCINDDTLIVAGVDFSHIGLKFGHDMPAEYLESQATAHDQNLLEYLSQMNTESFWQESNNVQDRFNVCGFPALVCLLEVLSPSRGHVLNYQLRHEKPTQSAVSFAAVVFVKK
jgi:AmmeMemoRadiSam system protein B